MISVIGDLGAFLLCHKVGFISDVNTLHGTWRGLEDSFLCQIVQCAEQFDVFHHFSAILKLMVPLYFYLLV
jgi:hypothetical protein